MGRDNAAMTTYSVCVGMESIFGCRRDEADESRGGRRRACITSRFGRNHFVSVTEGEFHTVATATRTGNHTVTGVVSGGDLAGFDFALVSEAV